MYPSLPFGPLSLPTGPVLAILAVVLTLDVGGRYARRLGIHPDDLWNTGLLALAAGLIVARLWNVFQFWPIYQAEPILIFSLRPSGFAFWPGVVGAALGGYLYLLRRALDPVRMAAALAVGAAAGGVVLSISGHLTGELLGTPSAAPWALPYFGELRHPVGLYRALGLAVLCVALWTMGDVRRPGRTLWMAALGYSLVRLVTDAFLEPETLIAGFRLSQVVALAVALVSSAALARSSQTAAAPHTAPPTAPDPRPVDETH
jgi:phosphatidylglycerol:prolipoprotein diacylglycerol transferase